VSDLRVGADNDDTSLPAIDLADRKYIFAALRVGVECFLMVTKSRDVLLPQAAATAWLRCPEPRGAAGRMRGRQSQEGDRPLLADIVEKVENRSTSKIPPKPASGLIRRWTLLLPTLDDP
jgi:hypothetical protein